jgi:Zn-dependent metalloprotease
MINLKKAAVRWNLDHYIPKKVHGFLSESMDGTPRQAAALFLKENHESLKISTVRRDLRYDTTVESLGGYTVLFQQHFKGTPIHGAWVAVHVDRKNRVFLVRNDTVPLEKLKERLPRRRRSPRKRRAIKSIVQEQVRQLGAVLSTPIKKESMIYAYKSFFRPVWKVKFSTQKPAGSRILFIDKITCHVLENRDVLRRLRGIGRVFVPNPIVALNRDDLYDRRDAHDATFDNAYRQVVLQDLEPGGHLRGPYVDTGNTRKKARSLANKFVYTRLDDRFEEVMAYYHIDAVQRYIQSLGFSASKGILGRSIKVNAHGGPEDNSYYDPSPGKHDLTFGDGGVDDAEDADIILHEYGHAIQDDIVPGFGQSHEGGAMGEGFGDYLAASFFAPVKGAARQLRFAEWDVKASKGSREKSLRRVDSTKHYPEAMANEVHDDGEIWSACLWQVRKLFGREKADTIILESHFYLGPYADFRDGAEAIVMAARILYGSQRNRALRKVFETRGILQHA